LILKKWALEKGDNAISGMRKVHLIFYYSVALHFNFGNGSFNSTSTTLFYQLWEQDDMYSEPEEQLQSISENYQVL